MSAIEFEPNSALCLKSSSGKKWALQQIGKILLVSANPLDLTSDHPSPGLVKQIYLSHEIAFKTAKKLIGNKLSKGHWESCAITEDSDEFIGTFLESPGNFQKIQVSHKQVKVHTNTETKVFTYKSSESAVKHAREMQEKALATGYRKNDRKFTHDFDSSELSRTMVLHTSPVESQRKLEDFITNLEESEDEVEEQRGRRTLERTMRIKVEEALLPCSFAANQSLASLEQVVEDEGEDGVLVSYVFNKPKAKQTEVVHIPYKRHRDVQ